MITGAYDIRSAVSNAKRPETETERTTNPLEDHKQQDLDLEENHQALRAFYIFGSS